MVTQQIRGGGGFQIQVFPTQSPSLQSWWHLRLKVRSMATKYEEAWIPKMGEERRRASFREQDSRPGAPRKQCRGFAELSLLHWEHPGHKDGAHPSLYRSLAQRSCSIKVWWIINEKCGKLLYQREDWGKIVPHRKHIMVHASPILHTWENKSVLPSPRQAESRNS